MAEEDISDILKMLQRHPLREHASEIGMICVFWSTLEMTLDMLYFALLNTDEHTASVLISNSSMRDKVTNIKLLAYKKKPSDVWFSKIKKQIEIIDNDLRPLRNRYVHDYWLASSQKIIQINHTTKLYKPQSRQFSLKYYDAVETPISELLAFQVRLLAPAGHLRNLISELYASDVPTPSCDISERRTQTPDQSQD